MGDTAVHLAAMSAVTRITCTHLFPAFIKKAAEHGFDFTTLNASEKDYYVQRKKLRGVIPGHSRLINQFEKTVLQILIENSIYNCEGGNDMHHKMVLALLTNVPNPGLDVISESGKGGTAFYYAIQHYHRDEARLLLNSGANPVISGRKEYDLITLLPQRLNYATERLASARRCTPICDDDFFSSIPARDAENKRIANIHQWIEIIDKTKALMNHPRLTSSIEIRKNARILAQGVRGGSIFSTLPTELLIKIAGHTGTPRSHSTEDAEEIARQNLGKPPL